MFTQDDYINEIETARENGEKEGRELGLEAGRAEGKAEVANVGCNAIASPFSGAPSLEQPHSSTTAHSTKMHLKNFICV